MILGQTSDLPAVRIGPVSAPAQIAPLRGRRRALVLHLETAPLPAFVLVLLVWIVVSRSYRILLGSLAAFAAGAIVTSCIDPAALSQYCVLHAHFGRHA